jgi:hypothetical protein
LQALIPLEEAIRSNERNLLGKRSRDQHAVEGIAMMVRQATSTSEITLTAPSKSSAARSARTFREMASNSPL